MKTKKFTREERSDADGFAVSSITYITNRRTCVAVKLASDTVKVRHTKNPKRILTFTPAEWKAFIGGVKAGEFDF